MHKQGSVKCTYLAIWYLVELKDYMRGKIPFYFWHKSYQSILKYDALYKEMILHWNITKLGEITAFINKEMEDERNTDLESRVCFAY